MLRLGLFWVVIFGVSAFACLKTCLLVLKLCSFFHPKGWRFVKPRSGSLNVPPPKSNMTIAGKPTMNESMYFLLKMGDFPSRGVILSC